MKSGEQRAESKKIQQPTLSTVVLKYVGKQKSVSNQK